MHPTDRPSPPSRAHGVYVALSVGIKMTGNIDRFFDHPIVLRPRRLPADALGVVGWGLKRKSLEAVEYARRVGLPYLALEDGFLRSVGLGNASPPQSLIIDDVGVYFDAHRPSRLEGLIAAPHSDAQRQRAARLAEGWRAGRLSKYNHAREKLPPVDGPFVLAVDQTFGDASIEYGMASAASFKRMLEAALDENPGLPVVLKVHPDVIAGRRQGHFDALTARQSSRVVLLSDNAHPPPLFERAHSVYVVTSQMGLEALVWGKPVRTFGMPFYAGWGLTQDEQAAPDRRRTAHPVTADDLVHAALVEYPRYIDPETLARCEPERLVAWMSLQRRMRERFAPQVQAVGFSDWKQPVARAFFGGSTLRFTETARPPEPGEAVAIWGRADLPPAVVAAAPVLRVEDGFLRSVGLGAHWVPPVSWVVDTRGIYYDATVPSDLEHVLEHGEFPPEELARAQALRQAIVAAGITKYNVGAGTWQRPAAPGRSVVLVPGQVETDASIAFGAPGIRSNGALLQAVRAARPEAYIVYKPHPDVLAKTREGPDAESEAQAQARQWCDEIVTTTPIHRLFEQVDEVQVLTSLAGFEALLRGLPVVCHGSPFYSGWGLTTDVHATPRRTRRLQLDELVAGALLRYPAYVSRVSGSFTTAERALYELQNWSSAKPPVDPWHLRALRRLKRWRDRLRQA
jgi:capsular polysaccharide export protein